MKINLKVQPKSGRQEIIRVDEDSYKVFLKKSPEDNKANEELTKLLKKYFNEKNVKIIKGLTSRNKIIEVK
ncbi:DUF167 domain-containing protein [archaeon]|jgi:uncharacterized protein (TIGR00251 family)|nr:DUF167 domain-containing protein [archaeon]MBT6182316.1 DUF167 domain-containing protein [archaeon]MBT6606662.1 DUF167 domain-containing protein [archaeon]MBT7251905.1 DUF167 domain-containing protein [archaeon]MBT7660587.1 DUF167 domain-containing protein [archaeon]